MQKVKYLLLLSIVLFALSTTPVLSQAVQDPLSLPVYVTNVAITLDGILSESSWTIDVPHLMFKKDGAPSGNSNTPTSGIEVKPPYTDISTCNVKFLRSGFDLYISLNSDDHQVCQFDWEGDGLFMKIKNASGANEYEIKSYVGSTPQFVFETNAPAGVTEGVGYPLPGTTIFDSTDVDNGYTCEVVIHLDQLGFSDPLATVTLLINVFDPDNYSSGSQDPWGPNGNYYKQWWGSEWGGIYRELIMSNVTVPVELTSFTGSYVGQAVKLNWTTATEVNNNGFEIQRSSEGGNFVTVGFVQGKGTSTEATNYSFVDKNISSRTEYSYRLKQIDFDGNYSFSDIINLGASLPVSLVLNQNYPNPFNPVTNISFALPSKSNVSLEIYNLVGQKVMTLVQGNLEKGPYSYTVDASNLSSGIYIYSLSATGDNGIASVITRKMTLLK
ncbi:MAG: T9SS type A sorting domain-containing protein [Ignavibacteria bacterium]|nr:T9SS type A sorting domain-containing protein [Ignavibacteria bacterium]